MDVTAIREHVAGCAKCRTADRIGRLCPIGRRKLDSALFGMLADFRRFKRSTSSDMSHSDGNLEPV